MLSAALYNTLRNVNLVSKEGELEALEIMILIFLFLIRLDMLPIITLVIGAVITRVDSSLTSEANENHYLLITRRLFVNHRGLLGFLIHTDESQLGWDNWLNCYLKQTSFLH